MGLFDAGDDEGGTSFLANLHNQQRKLDNLGPSRKSDDSKGAAVQKAPSQAKKAGRFALAADDDDDDFFAEFNVDLDMDGDSAPPKPALSTVPEQSDNLDTNAVAAAAADDDESAVEASSIPMATDQAFSEPAAPDAAPEAADSADVQPGAHDGQASMNATTSSKADVHAESAAASMQVDAPSIMDEGSAAGHEAMHEAETSSPPRPAPLPMLSQVADESVSAQLDDAREAAQLVDRVDVQHVENQATAQSPGAASVTQPADSHGRLQPAQAPATVPSENANALPDSACDIRMAEAPEEPSQQVDAVASSEPAEGAAVTQLMEGLTAAQLSESTALTEPADIHPISNQAAVPMQTVLPTPPDQGMAFTEQHDQPELGTAELRPPQLPPQLQSSKALAAGAEDSMLMEAMQSGVDSPLTDVAGSGSMPDNGIVDTVKSAETSTTTAPGTAPVCQNSAPTGMADPSAHKLAQHDTDRETATSQGDGLTDHPMSGVEPVGSNLRQSQDNLPGPSGAQSDVRSTVAAERAEFAPNQSVPSIKGLENSCVTVSSDALEKQMVSVRPQTGSASEHVQACLPLSKTTVPAETYTAKPSTALTPQAGNPNRGASMLIQAATPPPGPASQLSKQPSTPRPALPASSGFQNHPPVPAKTALMPLFTSSSKSGRTPFKSAAASPFPVSAGQAVSGSPLTALTAKVLQKPPTSASKTIPQAGTGNMSSMQRHSAQPSPSMSSLVPKLGVPSLVRTGGQPSGKIAMPLTFKPASLPHGSAKPASKGTGAFPNLFKRPSRSSGGGTRSAAAVSPVSGITPLQAGVLSSLPARSSHPAGLPQNPCTSKTAETARAAPSAGATPHKPVTQAVGMHPNVSPLPGQGMYATRDHHMTKSPCSNQQAATPPEQSLPSTRSIIPEVQTQAGTRPGALTAHGSGETDTVMEEEVQGRQADPKPWTSTSLAAGLMGNMRNLEEMLLEIQQMHDDVLEHKVNVAISSNRLSRLDNPIVHDKLKSLKRQAEMIFQSC